ncbi:MAG TPA: TlpA family protein disulfide reductase, partial [Chromatiaceae bacterium]|nr:TlpA family protein disulfide reductase [Chromatiaceae bacterium]
LALLVLPAHAIKPGKGLTEVPGKPQAPQFELTDIDGRIYRLSDYRGKVLIVNFWATWCPPCREEMPSMERAWQEIKDQQMVMIAINVGEDEDAVFQFTASYPVTFPLLLDQDSEVAGAWGVRGLPTTYVVDPQGRIVYRAIGGREWDDPELLQAVRALKNPLSE